MGLNDLRIGDRFGYSVTRLQALVEKSETTTVSILLAGERHFRRSAPLLRLNSAYKRDVAGSNPAVPTDGFWPAESPSHATFFFRPGRSGREQRWPRSSGSSMQAQPCSSHDRDVHVNRPTVGGLFEGARRAGRGATTAPGTRGVVPRCPNRRWHG